MDEENKPVKQGSARFRPAADKLVIGACDCDNWKKLQILPDVHIRSVNPKRSSDRRANLDKLLEMVGSFSALDGAFKPKHSCPMKYGPMKGGGAKGSEIAEDGNSFQKVGLSNPVQTKNDICARREFQIVNMKVAEAAGGEIGQLHVVLGGAFS